jgi:hypothetical protein
MVARCCQMKSTRVDWVNRHGKYLRSGIVALHEAAEKVAPGISDVRRFAFGTN